MLRTKSFSRMRIASLIALFLVTIAAAPALAGTISYGNFGPIPPGYTFQNVMESSGTDPVPLFGPPDPFSVGLDFDPTSFVSTSNGGNQDVTDGQLNFGVLGSIANPINSINLFEAGDYSLAGVGTSATSAFAGAIIRVTVTQINGVDVVPFDLAPSNASVGFNLIANPGILQPWSLGTSVNIASQLPQGQRATEVEVAIDNQLLTFSQAASLAFIAKKDFRIDIGNNPPIPEPGTMMMALLAVTMTGAFARRSR
jgi:PEP-CTERM motif